ncbi:MAG: TetR/AcrR family transcriptional regulator [Gemmatimonadetes bacterium]|nr:TetR/AcrR family transcriptional regulator [Gemmatimonadota bacterium]
MKSTGYLQSGRTEQKQRTRRALLAAARELVQEGEEAGIAQVAERAGVSRATAYRYFPGADALFLEAPLDAHTLSPEEILPDEHGSAEDRAVRVQDYLFTLSRDNEPAFRAYLASVMDAWRRSGGESKTPLRGNRRRAMLERALAPRSARMNPEAYSRLMLALSVLVGTEAVITLKDVCGADPEEGKDAIAWAVRVLVRSAMRCA